MTESGGSATRRGRSATLKAGASVKPELVEGANNVALERLLDMAQRYRREGNLREAMDLFWELAEDYPATDEAGTAKTILLELATSYEQNDAPHMARSIYERLLADGED